MRQRAQNLASLVYHELGPDAFCRLKDRAAEDRAAEVPPAEAERSLLLEFPQARREARRNRESGAKELFAEQHHLLLEPAISFFCQRIRTYHLLP